MDVTFIILTWNSSRYILDCLDSIVESMRGTAFSYEVYVVDNGSTDGTVDFLKDYQGRYKDTVKPIFLDHNTGTTYSRNLAIKQANGKYIAVMDSDVQLKIETISELISALDSDMQIGLAAPRLIYANGSLQKSFDQFPTLWRKLYRLFFLKRMEQNESDSGVSMMSVEIDYAISAFWLLRREVMEKVGLLDERIFYAPEDVDYCLRIWQHGYKIMFIPNVYAIHHAQEISRGFRFNKATVEHVKGLIYFFIKHRYFLRKPTFTNTL